MLGLVTSSQAMLTLLFSPPLMLLFPLSPILESLIPNIPSSCMVSSVLNFFASKLISRGRRSSALYSTVSYTVSVDMSVSSWST